MPQKVRIPLPNVPNVIKALIGGFVDNLKQEVWANVLHFLFGGPAPSPGIIQQIAQGIAGAFSANMSAEMPSPGSLEVVRLTDLTSDTASEGEWVQHFPGTRGDDSIPANVAALVSYPVKLRYQGGHPRSYLFVGGNADFQGAAEWSNAFAAEYLTHWHNFLNACLTVNAGGTILTQLVAISYIDKEENPTPPYRRATPLVMPLDLTQMYGHLNVHSQRRRIKEHASSAEALVKGKRIFLPNDVRFPSQPELTPVV